MKKYCILIFVLIGLSGFKQVSAQCTSGPPCEPDCPNTIFGPYQTTTITIQPGCVLEITYASRIACGIWFDYYIAGVQIIQFSGCPFSSGDVAEILEKATIALINQNPAGFPPFIPVTGEQCSTTWRAGKGACWEQVGDCLVPCTPTQCCLNAYKVCVDATGHKTIIPLGNMGGPPVSCPIGQSGTQCIDICN
jgi:hypothetical protein